MVSRLWPGLALPAFAACVSTVEAPTASPQDPVEVFVLRESLHTGVVLPPLEPDAARPPGPQDDEYVEFGFGEWSWYALGRDAWYHGFGAMLWPTEGTLARRTFRGAATPAALRRNAWWAELAPLTVERSAAATLRRRLQAEFDAAQEYRDDTKGMGFRFARVRLSYCLWLNCADRAAGWLRELGCRVWWAPVRRGLQVR